MKMAKKLFIVFMVLVFVLLLSGCSALVQSFENKELRDHTDVMLNAVLMNDPDAAYTLVSDICSKSEFDPVFSKMYDMLKDVESYELKLISINQKSSFNDGKGVTTTDSVYEMKAQGKKYIVSVQKRSDFEKLSSFYVTPYEKTNLYYTGVIQNMKDASLLQWGFLLSNLVVIALMVIALIDCCRHKIKLKPLWVVIILLGALSLGATISASSFHFNFNLMWFAAYTAFVRYGGGQVTVRFVIPWGIALYFVLRHWLIKKEKPEHPSNEIATEINEQSTQE